MRYLYGDLTEFPQQENTLQLLERFIDMAVDVLKLDHEIDKALQSIEGDREFLTEALEDIESFRTCLHEAIESTVAGRPEEDVISVLAQGVADSLSHYVDDGKTKVVTRMEQRIQQTQSEIGRYSQQILKFLQDFYMNSGIPLSKNNLRCKLEGETYHAEAEILDLTGVLCSYKLDTRASGFFSSPKRFGDLSPGRVDFPVGTKRARFKKEPVAETMRLDDALVSSVTDLEDYGEYRLAKNKGNGTEGMLVRILKGAEGGLRVVRVETDGAQYPIPEDLLENAPGETLSEFWKQLFPQVVSLYRNRAGISAIKIEDRDVVKERKVPDLISRLVRFLAPTIREIDARSPAVEELSLKIEHEGGRREEIYIQKKKLTQRFLELPESRLSLFEPLGITPQVVVVPGASGESQFDDGPTEPGAREPDTQ